MYNIEMSLPFQQMVRMTENRLPDRSFKAWKQAAKGDFLSDDPFREMRGAIDKKKSLERFREHAVKYTTSGEAEVGMIERDVKEIKALCKRVSYERKNKRS